MQANTLSQRANMTELTESITSVLQHSWNGGGWHEHLASQFEFVPLFRFLERWHTTEAKEELCDRSDLKKLIIDKLKIRLTIDTSKSFTDTIDNKQDVRDHFKVWLAKEAEYLNAINNALMLAYSLPAEVYEKLFEMKSAVEDEIFNAEKVYDALETGSWSAEICQKISEIIHEYFEHKHKLGCRINFNIG